MKVLYIAPDQELPGTHGGSVHTIEVAKGLSAAGHEVKIVSKGNLFRRPVEETLGNVTVHRVLNLLPSKLLRFLSAYSVLKIAQSFKPDCMIERYYNFGGEGIFVSRRLSSPLILEVNSPMIEPGGTLKESLDKKLLFGLLSRWSTLQAKKADAIITPLKEILPQGIDQSKIFEMTWGANVLEFDPCKCCPPESLTETLGGRKAVAFLGSFRNWHGVMNVVEAARIITKGKGRGDVVFLMIGGGPLENEAKNKVDQLDMKKHFIWTGRIPNDQVPKYLSAARAGLAPFDLSSNPYFKLGFYWSPLKIFEYMSMELPVVTLDVSPLNRIVREGLEGILFKPGDMEGFSLAILRLLDDERLAMAIGKSARARVKAEFSWEAHCRKLGEVMDFAIKRRGGRP